MKAITVRLDTNLEEDLSIVKSDIGLTNDSEALRFLIRERAKAIRRQNEDLK